MKSKLLFITLVIFSTMLTACSVNNTAKEKPYSLKLGAYGFEKVFITNIITKEVEEKTFDDIINDKTAFKEWHWLFSFSVGIDENTEYVLKKNNLYFVLNEGLAYEVVGDNSLKLHFPRWESYDNKIYDVVIFMDWQKLYN